MRNPVKLGIIGAGSVSRLMHLKALQKLKDKFTVEVICDTDPNQLKKVSKDFALNKNTLFTSNPSEVINYENLNAVAVLTPTESHVELTLKALANKKHVFLEKPAAVLAKDIRIIISAEKKSKRFVQVGMVLRYSSFYKELIRIIGSGKHGNILWMNWLETRPFDPMLWRYSNTSKNGDAIIHDKAVHQINLFNAFADSKPEIITAIGGQYLINNKRFSKVRAFTNEVILKGDSNDHLMTLIQYRNGIKASLTISYVSPHARESRWIIQCEKAKIIAHFETFVNPNRTSQLKWKGHPSSIYVFKDDMSYNIPWRYPMSYPPNDKNLVFYDEYKSEPLHPGSSAQWLAFYDVAVKNKKPLCNTALALDDTVITEAISKSIKQKRTVKL